MTGLEGSLIAAGVSASTAATIGTAASVLSVAATIASAAYSLLNQPGRQEVGKLTDTKIQTSTYGRTMPLGWGTYPVNGNIIWSSDLKPHTKNVGGKGKGGGATQYEYTVDIAISLRAGEITGIRRIWADEQLIYSTIASEAASILDAPSGTVWDGVSAAELLQSTQFYSAITVHKGTDTQGRDPLIASYRPNAPAYRGQAYVVFTDFNCAPFGNRRPNFRFEIMTRHTEATLKRIDQWEMGTGVASQGGATWNWMAFIPHTLFSFPGGYYAPGLVKLFFTAENSPSKYLIAQRDILNEGVSLQLYGDDIRSEDNDYSGWDIPESQRPGFGGLVALCGAGNTLFKWYEIPGQPTKSQLYVYQISTGNLGGTIETQIGSVTCNYKLSGSYQWHSVLGGASLAMDPDLKTIVWCNNGGLSLWELSDDYADITQIAGHPAGATEFYAATKGSVFIPSPGIALYIATYPTETWSISTYIYAQQKKPQPTYLWEIVRELCLMAGLQETQIDVTELTDPVKGYYLPDGTHSYRQLIGTLQAAFSFDAVESGYKILFPKRGKAPVATIYEHELGAGMDVADSFSLKSRRVQELEMPRIVWMRYIDGQPRKNGNGTIWPRYNPRTVPALRINTLSKQEATHDVPVIMSELEARRCSDRLLTEIWVARTSRDISLMSRYLALDPCDVIRIYRGNELFTVKILSTEFDQGVIKINVQDEEVVHAVTADIVYDPTDTEGYALLVTQGDSISVPTPGMLIPLDIPLLRPSEDYLGSYVGISATTTNWPGATLFQSYTEGQSWDAAADVRYPAIAGTCQNALGAYDPNNAWDDANTLTVRLYSTGMQLASATESAVLGGANLAAVGSESGGLLPGIASRWEIIGFTTAVNNGNGTWTISHIKRAGFGTEHNTGNHLSGDVFVLLDINEIRSWHHNLIGWPLLAAVTIGGSIDDAVKTQFQVGHVRKRPLSPINVTATASGADVVLTWTRRDRYDPPWPTTPGAALSESSENYEIVVNNGSETKRILTATTPTVTYTEAMKIADGFGPGVPPGFTVYQMSALVGRGIPSETASFIYT